MIYWKYLKKLLVHKWYVFLAGRLTGVPLWRLIIHDWSKFLPIEFINYARWSFGAKSVDGWAKAWGHHQNHNPHHPEYWVLAWRGHPDFYNGLGQPIADFVTVLPMPEIYVREMIADLMASERVNTDKWDMAAWLNENGPKMHLHDDTVVCISKVMFRIGYRSALFDWTWEAGDGFREWSGE